ncbi:hypothetical protein BJY16_004878 [Actinoplanes octamycinicus]|uniref:Uncharacterized protein n=1 Tax=Actinoplanes octamycinicus TaxID=135948 RepID=A0A7W7H044_9ACTN|nr:hypothetical protein [Actinoplanes octamycinicus]MBB4741419.1 hypothetical protein [Actinoplanes octamycinicus]
MEINEVLAAEAGSGWGGLLLPALLAFAVLGGLLTLALGVALLLRLTRSR